MKSFPFRAFAEGVRDALRAAAEDEFGAGVIKLIEHDDHWLRPSTVAMMKDSRLPAIFVALNAGQTDENWGHHAVGTDIAYDIFFIESADRVGQLRLTATIFIQWIYATFTGEDFPIPNYDPPDGVLLKHCIPLSFQNFSDLLEMGLVGAKVTVEVSSSSEEPES